MDTYYIRHTKKLGIDESTRRKLWREQRIAIHFPRDKDGRMHKRDNMSLNLADYDSRGRRAMSALTKLAKDGGYVCAEYYQHDECILGYVKPVSKIKLYRGGWGSETKYDGREAILKSLRLQKVKTINKSKSTVFLVGRPRQGTIMRWRNVRKTIENIVEGRKNPPSLRDLSYSQQEVMCSEFLRSEKARQLGSLNC